MPGVPLVRWLSKCHVASREEARALVRAGRVAVNGRVVTDGRKAIEPRLDAVVVDGRAVHAPDPRRDLVWWAVNKPRDVVATTKDPDGRPTVMGLLPGPHAAGLAPVGRLDRASAGLLLLTNDHAGAARLLDPASHVAKTYRVKARGHPTSATLRAWREESRIVDDLVLGPMDVAVERVGPRSVWLLVGLSEGKNRQIRRRLAADGHPVEVLVRIAFGPILLGDLAPGAVRRLTPEEVHALEQAGA